MADTGDDHSESETAILDITYQEARRTVDGQIHLLEEIDSKAARLLRLNLVLIGIVLTGLSIIATPDTNGQLVNASDLLNPYTTLGVVLLFSSTVLAGLTYTASHVRAGMNGSDLRDMLWNDYSDRQNIAGLIQSYSRWIEQNYLTNLQNAPLSTLTILFLIYSLTAFGLGVIEIVHGAVPGYVLASMLGMLVVVTHLTELHEQIRRYMRERERIS